MCPQKKWNSFKNKLFSKSSRWWSCLKVGKISAETSSSWCSHFLTSFPSVRGWTLHSVCRKGFNLSLLHFQFSLVPFYISRVRSVVQGVSVATQHWRCRHELMDESRFISLSLILHQCHEHQVLWEEPDSSRPPLPLCITVLLMDVCIYYKNPR